MWVHDYQLQLVPRMLRELRPDVTIGFFLHIPFPPTELFLQLPWRKTIVDGLLGASPFRRFGVKAGRAGHAAMGGKMGAVGRHVHVRLGD